MKRVKFFVVVALLLSALVYGAVQSQEALAVAPCETMCQPNDCPPKCACETPEWGIKITSCSRCPWFPNPCV